MMFNSVITLKLSTVLLFAFVIAVISATIGFLLKPSNSSVCLETNPTKPLSDFKPLPTNNGRRF